ATAKVKRVNDQEQIHALVDKKKVIITEDRIRSDLRFDDAEGTACLLNEKKQQPRRKQRKEANVSHDKSEDEDHVLTPSSDALPSAKAAQAKEIAALKKKFSKLNKWRKLRSRGLRRLKKIGSEIALDDETQGRKNDDEMFGIDDLAREKVVMETTTGVKDSAAPTTYVTEDEVIMAQAFAAFKSTKPKVVGMSFDEIKKLFDIEMRKVNDFIAMDSEAQESSTKRTAKHLESDISKKQKVDENVKPVIDDSEELKNCMEIVPHDGDEVLIEATLISSRSPTIIDYIIHKEGKKNYFKIIRAYAGSESRPPMLNKEDYVPWSSRLLRYAKSRPNRKLIHNSILNGPYVRRMIAEPGDAK
nr:ribonuclease H-like domain-containing protein [Tanacetum cinerariifolium]